MIIRRTETMTKKKTKRMIVRAPLNGHQVTRRHQFIDSGVVESILMLTAFVIVSSFILVFEVCIHFGISSAETDLSTVRFY